MKWEGNRQSDNVEDRRGEGGGFGGGGLPFGIGGRGIGLIAITGYGQAEDQRRAYDAGFDAHLTKPVAPERLRQVIAGLQ